MVRTPAEHVAAIQQGYSFDGAAVHLGAALVDGQVHPEAAVRLPLSMMNRHGLISGATGTGKTITLQVIAEQLSAHGVPVFLADIKGDLTGLSTPSAGSAKLAERTASVGQDWKPSAYPVEYFSLGGDGTGVPVRARISDFGPLLLSRVMELNETQESSLQLVFYYADKNDLELYNLADLRAVIQFLVSDDGKEALENLGGLSKATAGVILRELVSLEAQGMGTFFGETEFDTAELLRTAADGRGIISCLELSSLQQRPLLFSTFMMWLIADLFAELPEVGDAEQPKLVFFLDEAHLLFRDASKPFLQSIATTVRLIRSKGVGIFFVTQTPRDVPADVLGQLANRVQHALRAFTPEDAKALKSTVSTFPVSDYDLEEVLTSAGIGEAVVTVMNEQGAPTPVAWTRLCSPGSAMGPSPAATVQDIVDGSSLLPVYGPVVDSRSAFEKLTGAPVSAASGAGSPGNGSSASGSVPASTTADGSPPQPAAPPTPAPAPAPDKASPRQPRPRNTTPSRTDSSPRDTDNDELKDFALQTASVLGRELMRGLFGTRRRRRR
ncbi:MAG TPA: helicase HerA-like domain-containing protein [Arthrobacter sp.]|nr:helicase HerA-like domain-containing protein [Arthrobacter sp.]